MIENCISVLGLGGLQAPETDSESPETQQAAARAEVFFSVIEANGFFCDVAIIGLLRKTRPIKSLNSAEPGAARHYRTEISVDTHAH